MLVLRLDLCPPFFYTAIGNSPYPTPFVLTLGVTILENAEICNKIYESVQ